MAEPIKQEIINNIYENGEQLITGPVLQEVLLDMVDDYNAKDAALSSSVAEAIEAIPIVDPTVLATTESLNQLSESLSEAIPDVSGLATAESVNQLSESVAEAIADIPQPDLSGYATTQSVNEATESVKEWVEGKHYLTSASLSGSVTEETVGFMINDATASVKQWVESQSYATETFVSESIAGLDIPSTEGLATTESLNNLSESVAETIANLPQTDLSGYLTTESYNQDSASFDERINAITGSDLSGYATTASLNSLSESVASDFANLDIPDVSTLATTESVLELSESLASTEEIINDHSSDLESLNNAKSALEDTGIIYWDDEEETYVAPERVSQEDFTQFSESVANDVAELSESIANIPTGSTPQDLSGYLTTASYQIDSASFDQRIDAIVVPDLSTYATTASVNELSESLASDLEGIQGSIPDVSGYATTQSLNNVSQSLSASIAAVTGSTPDLSGYATTASLNSVSQSLGQAIQGVADAEDPDSPVWKGLESASLAWWDEDENIWHLSFDPTNANDPVGLFLDSLGLAAWDDSEEDPHWVNGIDVEQIGEMDALLEQLKNALENGGLIYYDDQEESYQSNFSESVAADITSLSESIASISGSTPDLSGYATTASLNNVSQSLSASIAAITSSGGDDTSLRNYLFGTGSTGETISPASASNWVWTVSQSATFTLDGEIGEGKSIQVIVFNNSVSESVISFNSAYYGPDSVVNGVVGTGSFSIPAGTYGDIVATQIGNKVYFRTSVDLSNIEVDLSGYATTASLNSVSQSLSASIAAITSSGGGGGDYLPLKGGELKDYENPMETQLGITAPDGDSGQNPRVVITAENPDYTDGHASVYLQEADSKEVTIRGDGTITFNIPESGEGEGDGVEATFNLPEEGSSDDTLATRGWVQDEYGSLLDVKDALEAGGLVYWDDQELTYKSDFSESVAADIESLQSEIPDVSGYATTTSLNSVSESLSASIAAITGSDLSGYATTSSVADLSSSVNSTFKTYSTTQSVNSLSQSISQSLYDVTPNLNNYATNVRVTGLSASFDARIDGLVITSGAVDPSKFAGAPTVVFETDGTYGLVAVNATASGYQNRHFIYDQNWQLTNLDLSSFDRIECYFRSSPRIVVLPLDEGTLESSGSISDCSCYRSFGSAWVPDEANLSTALCEKWVVVDSTKTKFQVAVSSNHTSSLSGYGLENDYLYKIVGYPKIV